MSKRPGLARRPRRQVWSEKKKNGSGRKNFFPAISGHKDWAEIIRQQVADVEAVSNARFGKNKMPFSIFCIECQVAGGGKKMGFQTRERILCRRGSGRFSFDKGPFIELEDGLPTGSGDPERAVRIDKKAIRAVIVS